jgi:hypothetical protein
MFKKCILILTSILITNAAHAALSLECDVKLMDNAYKSFYTTTWKIDKLSYRTNFLHQKVYNEEEINGNKISYNTDVFYNPRKKDFLYFKTEFSLGYKTAGSKELSNKSYTITDEIELNKNKVYTNGTSFLAIKCYKIINKKTLIKKQ